MYKEHSNTGFTKLTYSHMQQPDAHVAMRLFEDPERLVKQASDIFECPREELKPDKDHVAVHVVALGDYEHYGQNRNGDAFRKKACEDRHDTFVKSGHVFVQHDNQDPEKALGRPVKSAYDKSMGRIELVLHVHKDKGQDQLHKLASDGTHGFSMACYVPFDSCNVCNTPRRGPSDPNQCEHLRDHLGKVFPDGKVACMQNDYPTWFDISFVHKPADRIAYDLQKIAASGEAASYKLAEAEGIWVPDHILARSYDGYTEKLATLQALGAVEQFYIKTSEARPMGHDFFLWELRKAASVPMQDEVLDQLRNIDIDELMPALAKRGCILSPRDFFRYVLGPDYGEMKSAMPEVLNSIRSGVFSRLLKHASSREAVCKNIYFDVDEGKDRVYASGVDNDLCKKAFVEAENTNSVSTGLVNRRVIETTMTGKPATVVKQAAQHEDLHPAALVYAAYKLSAVQAVIKMANNIDDAVVTAVAAAQNVMA